jgi:SAM-dependent methyltransferase
MSRVEILSRQYRWRRWSDVYPYLGDLSEAEVVDLGCGIGDQTRDLSRLGAHVFGVDGNQDVIDHAKSRGIPHTRFVCCDITDIKDTEMKSDGVWTSFTAAYFPRFDVLTRSIDSVLKPDGWLAITEVNDLFGHEPLHPRWSALIEKYYAGRSKKVSIVSDHTFTYAKSYLDAVGVSMWIGNSKTMNSALSAPLLRRFSRRGRLGLAS